MGVDGAQQVGNGSRGTHVGMCTGEARGTTGRHIENLPRGWDERFFLGVVGCSLTPIRSPKGTATDVLRTGCHCEEGRQVTQDFIMCTPSQWGRQQPDTQPLNPAAA